jgi:TnpA family transposase
MCFRVANQCVRFTLPRHWSSDKTAIADGVHVKLRENNHMESTHIRYGGYGCIAYRLLDSGYQEPPESLTGFSVQLFQRPNDRGEKR